MQNHHLSDKAGEKQDGAFLAFEFRGRRNAFWNFNDHLLQMLLLPSPPRPKSNISPFSQLLLCGRNPFVDVNDHMMTIRVVIRMILMMATMMIIVMILVMILVMINSNIPPFCELLCGQSLHLSLSPCQRLNAEITSCP